MSGAPTLSSSTLRGVTSTSRPPRGSRTAGHRRPCARLQLSLLVDVVEAAVESSSPSEGLQLEDAVGYVRVGEVLIAPTRGYNSQGSSTGAPTSSPHRPYEGSQHGLPGPDVRGPRVLIGPLSGHNPQVPRPTSGRASDLRRPCEGSQRVAGGGRVVRIGRPHPPCEGSQQRDRQLRRIDLSGPHRAYEGLQHRADFQHLHSGGCPHRPIRGVTTSFTEPGVPRRTQVLIAPTRGYYG
jgi:hypothetical protein